MTKKLTDVACGTLPKGDYEDHIVPGLRLRVGARTRTFELRLKRNGTRKSFTVGRYGPAPLLTLADARKKAVEMTTIADSGQSFEKVAAVLSGEATVNDLLIAYEKHRMAKGERVKALPESMRQLRVYLADDLDKPRATLDKERIRKIRDAIAYGTHKASRKPALTASNRFLSNLSPVMTWAASEEWDGVEANPVSRMTRKGSVNSRERVLTDAEIRAVWAACEGIREGNRAGVAYGRLVRFLLSCGQRKSEGASMRYGHVLDGIWKQGDNKSDRTHWLKLPPLALAALGEGEARAFAFEGKIRDQMLNGFSALHRALVRRAGTDWWTLHDLRRTMSTRLEGLKVDDKYIHAVLNHGKQGLKKNYFHDPLYDEKAETLATWDAALQRILAGKLALKVVRGGS